jgi:hypothetical protein
MTEDFIALLDVALEHHLDLACDIAYYGPSDYPMIARLMCALADAVPGFEFSSLRRWVSLPGQFEQLMGAATPITPISDEAGSIEQDRPHRRDQAVTRLGDLVEVVHPVGRLQDRLLPDYGLPSHRCSKSRPNMPR